MDATEIKDTKQTSKDRQFAEETVMKLAKTKKPETVGDIINVKKRRNKDSTEESEEKKRTIGGDVNSERCKGGGEHCARIYQEFMRTREQESITNLEESTHMQM